MLELAGCLLGHTSAELQGADACFNAVAVPICAHCLRRGRSLSRPCSTRLAISWPRPLLRSSAQCLHLLARLWLLSAQVQEPVEAMLEVAGYPDHTIASISFNFWHKLSRNLSRCAGGASAWAEGRGPYFCSAIALF